MPLSFLLILLTLTFFMMKENLSVPNQKEYYYQKQLLKLQTEAYLKRKEAQHKLFSL